MANYLHRVVGIYPGREEAEAAVRRLAENGVPTDRMRVLEPGRDAAGQTIQPDSDDVLKEVFADGAIGAAVGTGIGAVGTLALAAANISLFIASPLTAPLAMLGWGAGLGGLVGAAVGAQNQQGDVADLVKAALGKGHVVLVVQTASEDETTGVRQIVGESMESAKPALG